MVQDLFPDGETFAPYGTVGGVILKVPDSSFPSSLEQPATAAKAVISPFPDFADIVFAPLEQIDLFSALFVGLALQLGPDFLLAPAGLVSDKGIRPGYALESVVGAVLDPEAQWLKDRREELAATPPLKVRVPIFALFVAAGLLVSRLLTIAFEDQSFVVSIGICACIGGGFLEVIRERLPTREEHDLDSKLQQEFMVFAGERMEKGGRCHENDIIREFRTFYPRYRRRDMGSTADGFSLSDDKIGDLAEDWNRAVGRPGERTRSGYWKGIKVNATQTVRYA